MFRRFFCLILCLRLRSQPCSGGQVHNSVFKYKFQSRWEAKLTETWVIHNTAVGINPRLHTHTPIGKPPDPVANTHCLWVILRPPPCLLCAVHHVAVRSCCSQTRVLLTPPGAATAQSLSFYPLPFIGCRLLLYEGEGGCWSWMGREGRKTENKIQ